MGFTKLDENILMSSIMTEDPPVFKIWIALLAACKEDGIARVSAVGLSSHCFLPIEVVRSAIEKLSSPDNDSRSTNDDGRRISRVDGGYFVINYHKYRELSVKENEAKRKWEKRHCPDISGQVRNVPDSSASASSFASLLSEVLRGVWGEYLEMRRRIRKPATDRAQELILEKLERLAPGDDPKKKAILEQSIENSWQGVFELRPGSGGESKVLTFNQAKEKLLASARARGEKV